MSSPYATALIVAAGRGTRLGAEKPKQFLSLGGQPVLSHALSAFLRHPAIRRVAIVIHPDDTPTVEALIAAFDPPPGVAVSICHGGSTRQQSVCAGLMHLADRALPAGALVLIHDAARPLVNRDLIDRAIAAAAAHGAAIPVLPVTDTIVELQPQATPRTLDRARLRAVQTPQAFDFNLILAAHKNAAQTGADDFTDDASIAAHAGHVVATFEGDAACFKITTAEDFALARQMMNPALLDIRTATGYDVHTFGPGDHVTLGGIKIPHTRGVVGHSDADVLLHALTDALLGCIGDGDIGVHFPPSDMRWKGAPSEIFLAEAVRRVKARGGEIRHLDGSVLAEAPRIGKYRDAICSNISRIAGIDQSRVGLKATTSEKLGFIGREEGLAALATATIALPL